MARSPTGTMRPEVALAFLLTGLVMLSLAAPSLFETATSHRQNIDVFRGVGTPVDVISRTGSGSTDPTAMSWNVSGNGFASGQMSGTSLATNGSLILGPMLFPTNREIAIDVGPPGAADSIYARTPFVLKDTDGSYKMWYTGYDGARNRMLYATSPDGVHWTKHGVIMDVLTPPFYFDSVGRMSVIKNGSTYEGWFHAGFWSGGPFGYWGQIYHALSADGANWTITGVALPPNQSWDIGMTNVPMVLQDSHGVFWMYFTGWDGSNTRLGVATSLNGTSFVPYANNPILPLGPAGSWDSMDMSGGASVVVSGSAWTMWYDGTDRVQDALGLAHSTDGFNWTKGASNPVFVSEPSPSWDDHGVGQPDLFASPGGPRLYFTGSDGSYVRIGTANLSQPPSYMGSYTSSIFDSGTPGTQWQTLSWTGGVPTGSTMDLLVRVGSDPVVDATWTSWTRPVAGPIPPYPPALENLSLPRDRFVQFAISFTTTNTTIVPWVASVTVTFVQNHGPVATIIQPAMGAWLRGPPTVTWTTSDPDGDAVLAVQIQMSADSAFRSIAMASGVIPAGSSAWVPSASFADGVWYLRVSAEDAYGMWGNWTVSSFNLDGTPPIISVISPGTDSVVHTSAPDVSWSALDPGSGIDHFEVRVDGGPRIFISGGGTGVHLTGLADGTHTITITGVDRAGNAGSVTVTIRVDTNLLSPTGPYGFAPSVLLVGGIMGLGAAAAAGVYFLVRRLRRAP